MRVQTIQSPVFRWPQLSGLSRVDELERIGESLAADGASAQKIADTLRPFPKEEREIILNAYTFESGLPARAVAAMNILASSKGLSTGAMVGIAGGLAVAAYLVLGNR